MNLTYRPLANPILLIPDIGVIMDRMTHNWLNLAGKKFTRLTALEYLGGSNWKCRCDCGKELITQTGHLMSGHTKSCGCYKTELATARVFKHGMCYTPEFAAWTRALQRCHYAGGEDYKNYGARGIRVYKPWRKNFQAFFDYIGAKPSPLHSLDRIDTNGNYEPGNVKWSTAIEQGTNRRTTKFWTLDGIKKSRAQWARDLGLVRSSDIVRRLERGWTLRQALTIKRGGTIH